MRDYFRKIPKADVHNHLHLGGKQQRFFEAYPMAGIVFPNSYNGLDGMINFIYGRLNSVMAKKEDVVNFMAMAIESSIEDNVTYLEASIDVNLARFFDGSIDALITSVKSLKATYKHQIEFRPDIGINKDLPIDKVYAYGEAFIDSGIFNGIDIYGKELDRDIAPFKDLFKTAKAHNLKTKVHIGEFSDAHSVEKAIHILNPDEIQHGINAVNSEKVIDLILERGIRLNICPASNICLGSVKNLKKHPIRTLFDKGVKVSVNTDDLILFNSTISDQLAELVEQGVFSFDEAETIRRNGFNR